MRLNKEKLASLAALPDDELWGEILKLAGGYGITLPKTPPSHTDMEKIRNAVGGGAKINLSEAMKVLNNYKRGK